MDFLKADQAGELRADGSEWWTPLDHELEETRDRADTAGDAATCACCGQPIAAGAAAYVAEIRQRGWRQTSAASFELLAWGEWQRRGVSHAACVENPPF